MRGENILKTSLLKEHQIKHQTFFEPCTAQNILTAYLHFYLFSIVAKFRMPTFKCLQCKQEKDGAEYDQDRQGVLHKSCRAYLVCITTLTKITK